MIIDTSAFTTFTGIKVVGGTGNNTVTVGASGIDLTAVSTNSVNHSVSIDLLTTGGADTLNVNGAIKTKGDGQVSLASRSISITADITTTTGNIVLDADNSVQQVGTFIGVKISGTGVDVTTGGGNITIEGRGGDTGGNNYGVYVQNGGKVQAGNNGSSTFGTVSVTGTGGAAGAQFNYGVLVDGTGSIITSSGGAVTVTGTGGGTGTSSGNRGVFVSVGEISAGGTGTVSVTGTGGVGAGSTGIDLTSAGTITTNASGAAITLTANSMNFDTTSVVSSTGTVTLRNKTAGVAISLGTASSTTFGLSDLQLDRISAGTLVIGRDDAFLSGAITVSSAISRAAGNLTLLGRNILITADLSTGTGNIVLDADNGVQQTGGFAGVKISGAGVDVITIGGNITIEGRGGNQTGGEGQRGVSVSAGAKVQAGNDGGTLGTVTVIGFGGTSTNVINYGVEVTGTNSLITSSGGAVAVTGTGGGSGTSNSNDGVYVGPNGQISAGGTGMVTIIGTGGATSGDSNNGVSVSDSSALITSSGGAVAITGIGGGSGTSNSNYGVYAWFGGQISAGGTGTVTVIGTGGNLSGSGNTNIGVRVHTSNSKITSSGGAVAITGTGGGSGTSSLNDGVYVGPSGQISAGGTGTVSVIGTGGSGANNFGINIPQGTISTPSGAAITLTTDTIDIANTISTVSSTGTVTLRNKTAGVTINLGTASSTLFGLFDSQLDRITAGTLVIGRNDGSLPSGIITVSSAISRAAGNLSLIGPAASL